MVLTFAAIIGALRAIAPSRIPRHLVFMGLAVIAALVAGVIDSNALMSFPLSVPLLHSFYGVAVILRMS